MCSTYHGVTRDEDSKAKKERVLHTRIPAVLEAELKSAASALKVPVSNLVRTILEDAVAVADRASSQIETGLERAAKSVHAERKKLRRLAESARLTDVVGYQPVLVAVAGQCASCGVELEAGVDAFLGVTAGLGPKIFVCQQCVPGRPKPKKEAQDDDS